MNRNPVPSRVASQTRLSLLHFTRPSMAAAGQVSSSAMIAAVFCLFALLPRRSMSAAGLCGQSSCDGRPRFMDPVFVRFPFRLRTQQNDTGCGYSPAFDLSCNSSGLTILNLAGAGDFAVQSIDYQSQTIVLGVPDSTCLERRLLENSSLLSLTPPFRPSLSWNFTLLNCSAEDSSLVMRGMEVSCLSSSNFTVISTLSSWYDGSSGCQVLGSILVPVSPSYCSNSDMCIRLTWDEPGCGSCERRKGVCGFKNNNGSEIGCVSPSSSGISRAAKYGIVLGAGIPGILFLIGLTCFACGRFQVYRQRPRTSIDFSAMVGPRPMLLSVGLDKSTIESYPKVELGESKRLPKPNDNTCSICLCEYQPKETLRTIPECNHYFHASCVDEWLRLNASCPLCRNSPDPSVSTPSTSLSSSASVASSV